MKQLILHGSNKKTNGKKRLVVPIEFSNKKFPRGLEWSEKLDWDKLYSQQYSVCALAVALALETGLYRKKILLLYEFVS
ncbi:MAG: hypothetical protein ORN54_12270 [Cyclobacteriaceae bacterium]|nr:hypothetical protein [Cyclobacteriaceae bacterium]